MLSADEQLVVDYLNTAPGCFFSSREVCRKAGSKAQWEENPRWAIRILTRLLERGVLEQDAAGHYRIAPRRHG